jgi:glycosyltransferase involved in cell wall biosynthesis
MEIIVITDGCTDMTSEIIRTIPDKRIKLIIKKTRLGQSSRENEILNIYRGDAILFLEADIILATEKSIEECIKLLIQHPSTAFIFSQAEPLPGYNLYSNATSFFESIRRKYIARFRNGRNIYALQHFKMLSRSFTANFRWPVEVHDDTYLFAFCTENHYKYEYSHHSKVYYRAPSNLRDYINKSSKFRQARLKLKSYFPNNFVDSLFNLPKATYINILTESLIRSPIYTLIYFFSFTISKIPIKAYQSYSPYWEPANSTKQLILK